MIHVDEEYFIDKKIPCKRTKSFQKFSTSKVNPSIIFAQTTNKGRKSKEPE